MAWYSHHFKNFSQFVVVHTVKAFGVVNKAKVDIFSGILLLFLMIQIYSTISYEFRQNSQPDTREQIQQHVKRNSHHKQVQFTPRMLGYFSI